MGVIFTYVANGERRNAAISENPGDGNGDDDMVNYEMREVLSTNTHLRGQMERGT